MSLDNETQQYEPISKLEKFYLLLVVISIISIFFLHAGWTNGSFLSPRPFDSQSWKSRGGWIDWQPSLRKAMVKDLIDNKRLIDLNITQVQELLGKGRLSQDGNRKHLSYFLGPLSFSIGADDSLYFGVEFESDIVFYTYTFEGL